MKLMQTSAAAIAHLLALFRNVLHLRPRVTFSNAETVGAGIHENGEKSYKADAAIATKNFVVISGTDEDHIAVGAADTEIPIGIADDSPSAAEDPVNVRLFGGAKGTMLGVANAAITVNDFLVSAGNGKVKTLPAAAATYYIIGVALQAAAADGDTIEINHCCPTQRVVT